MLCWQNPSIFASSFQGSIGEEGSWQGFPGIGAITEKSVDILDATSRGEMHLLALEAQWIRIMKSYLNTQDTMLSRDLKSHFNS